MVGEVAESVAYALDLIGDVRFILSSGGHITGIVNPPTPKAWYETNSSQPVDAASLARRRLAQRRFMVGGLDGLAHSPHRCHGRPRRRRK